MKLPIVAIGPAWRTGSASWQMVGPELFGHIAKKYGYDLRIFCAKAIKGHNIRKHIAKSPLFKMADVVVVVKSLPFLERLYDIGRNRRNPVHYRVVYFMVDQIRQPERIRMARLALRFCSRVVVQSPRMFDLLKKDYSPRVTYIPHHTKFSYSGPQQWAGRSGKVLWTGVSTNLPTVVKWHNTYNPRHEIILLTNACKIEARNVLAKLKYPGRVKVLQWNEHRHQQLLKECSAGFDWKSGKFRDLMKPPTKGIDFVASGIPVGLNNNCVARAILKNYGLVPPLPHDTDRLLSREYWDETQALRPLIRRDFGIDAIGEQVHNAIKDFL